MSLEDLERRVGTLEDIEAIRRLKARYCYYRDDNHDADNILELFVEDAVWDGGMRGGAEGREAIRDFFVKASQRLPFTVHMVLNPAIEVDGDAARGSWYMFMACTYAAGGPGGLGLGPLRRGVREGRRGVEVQKTDHRFLLLDPLRRGMGPEPVCVVREARRWRRSPPSSRTGS